MLTSYVLYADLIQCTNEPNVSIPQLANLLIERTQQTSWVIVFKSLVSVHNLMNYGNEVCCLQFFTIVQIQIWCFLITAMVYFRVFRS